MMKTWKKPEVSKANQELVEMNENEMNEVPKFHVHFLLA